MPNLFDDLQKGLKQAIEHTEGNPEVKVVTYKLESEYGDNSEKKERCE